jgi:hypothetical protein
MTADTIRSSFEKRCCWVLAGKKTIEQKQWGGGRSRLSVQNNQRVTVGWRKTDNKTWKVKKRKEGLARGSSSEKKKVE